MNKKDFYQQKEASVREELKPLKGNLSVLAIMRFLLFVATGFLVYLFWGDGFLPVIYFVSGVALFLFLVSRYTDLQWKVKLLESKAQLYQYEVRCLDGDWKNFEQGKAYMDPSHPFTSDLNIFGRNSLFQYLNRTQTAEGEKTLAKWLGENLVEKEQIEREGSIVSELSRDFEWIYDYLAHAGLSLKQNDKNDLQNWKRVSIWRPSEITKLLFLYVVPAAAMLLTICYAMDLVPAGFYGILILIPLILTGIRFKKNMLIFESIGKIEEQAGSYKELLRKIRQRKFDDPHFEELFREVNFSKAEAALQKLQKHINAVNQRNNMVLGIVFNIFLMWDYQCLYRLQKWQDQHNEDLENWFNLVWKMDAYLSLAIYRYNHPEFTDAETDAGESFDLIEAAHPLMPASQRVSNNFHFDERNRFAIITGANMAGKSTFLRTVGINLILAMRGLPVCAGKMRFKPARVYTSMLTVDSLGDNESFFFSELKRLRQIVDELQAGIPHFIILDEILKGTNSRDKAQGSERFMRKLLTLPAKGIIATHDLSLCELNTAFPTRIINQRFEVAFEKGELEFDYKLKGGICENMNATFLLEKMGLAADLE